MGIMIHACNVSMHEGHEMDASLLELHSKTLSKANK